MSLCCVQLFRQVDALEFQSQRVAMERCPPTYILNQRLSSSRKMELSFRFGLSDGAHTIVSSRLPWVLCMLVCEFT